jgi:hypothetical protein
MGTFHLYNWYFQFVNTDETNFGAWINPTNNNNPKKKNTSLLLLFTIP